MTPWEVAVRRELALFTLSHALHILLQRTTVGPGLRKLLILLAATSVGVLAYAYEVEETHTVEQSAAR